METDEAKKEDKKEGEKKEGESSSAASGAATSAPSMVVGEELNEMVKNIMGSYSPTLHIHFILLLVRALMF